MLNIAHRQRLWVTNQNKLSITSGQIGEALQQSASSLSVANNSLSESIAMIASAQKVVNDAGKVGTALKTVSLRVRGQ